MSKLCAIAIVAAALFILTAGVASAGSCSADPSILQRLETESILEDVALVHSIDPGLLSAMAQVESRECSEAVSSKGALGLMQLMPATADQFGVADPYDPVENALGAARFIDYLRRDRPQGKLSLEEILAAYNAGEGAVTRAHGIPHYRETEAYVRRVLWIYLIGHVPDSERELEKSAQPLAVHHTASTRKSTHHAAPPGSDGDILRQLAEVRRARAQAEAPISPNSR